MPIDLSDARKLVRAARKTAESMGKTITVAVVDEGGYLVALDRMTKARRLTPSIATAKAYSAAVMERPTLKLKGFASGEPELFAQLGRMGFEPVIAGPGAYPIVRDGTILGGIGISGGSGEDDERIALTALGELGFATAF